MKIKILVLTVMHLRLVSALIEVMYQNKKIEDLERDDYFENSEVNNDVLFINRAYFLHVSIYIDIT